MDLWWIGIALAAGAAARAVRLPLLVGYLVAGMVMAGFGVEGGSLIEQAGQLGVQLLLFTVGLSLRRRNVLRPEVLGVGGLHLLVMALLTAGAGLLAGWPPLGALGIGVAVGVSSMVVAARMLEEQHALEAFHGRVAIGILLLQTVVAVGVLIALSGEVPSPWALALLALPVLRPPLARLLDWIRGGELALLFGLGLAVGGAALFEAVGLGGELGALAAGVLLAGHDGADDLAEVLWALKELFLVGFFLGVGLVGIPSWAGLLGVLALTALLVVKAALFFGLFVAFRLRARTAFLAALPLTTYSGFTLVVGAAVVEAGLLPEAALTVLAVATAVSYALSAPAASVADVVWHRIGAVLRRVERSGRHPERRPATLGNACFLVVGMGRAGTAAYDYLVEQDECVAGVDDDPAKLAHHREEGRRVVYGDAADDGFWNDLDGEGLDGVVVALPDRELREQAVRLLRETGYGGPTSVLTADETERQALLEAGADVVYLSVEQAGRALAAYGLAQRTRRRDDAAPPEAVTLEIGDAVAG